MLPDSVLFSSTKPPAFPFALVFTPHGPCVRVTVGSGAKCCLGERDLPGHSCSWPSLDTFDLVLPPLRPGTPNCSPGIGVLATEMVEFPWPISLWRRALEEEDNFLLKFGKCWSFILAFPFLLPSLSSA